MPIFDLVPIVPGISGKMLWPWAVWNDFLAAARYRNLLLGTHAPDQARFGIPVPQIVLPANFLFKTKILAFILIAN